MSEIDEAYLAGREAGFDQGYDEGFERGLQVGSNGLASGGYDEGYAADRTMGPVVARGA